MTIRLPEFTVNITRCRDLVGLGQRLASLTNDLVDPGDIYRAALSQSVSALDQYIHAVVLDKSVEMLMGRHASAPPSRVALIPQAAVASILNESITTREMVVRAHLASALSKETFQTRDQIGRAYAAVGVRKVWSAAFGPRADAVATELGVIVGRRNRIVHQCDVDPLNPGAPVTMTDSDALSAITFLEDLVAAIDPMC